MSLTEVLTLSDTEFVSKLVTDEIPQELASEAVTQNIEFKQSLELIVKTLKEGLTTCH